MKPCELLLHVSCNICTGHYSVETYSYTLIRRENETKGIFGHIFAKRELIYVRFGTWLRLLDKTEIITIPAGKLSFSPNQTKISTK